MHDRNKMIFHVLRSLALVGVLVSTTLACSGKDQPAAVAAAEPRSTPQAADLDATDASCAEGDIECEERLYQLEETLFAYEAGIAKQLGESAQVCWKIDSDAFRRSVDECDSVACKEAALLARVASLHLLQPLEQRAALELPDAPELLAVLAPYSDAGEAVTAPRAEIKLEARGSLVHAQAHPEHMGIAVRADDQDHVFIFDMDIGNQPGQDDVLGLVGASPTAQVLVRGSRLVAPTGVANFDPAQCRWIYQVI
jgi:hypothetical protein